MKTGLAVLIPFCLFILVWFLRSSPKNTAKLYNFMTVLIAFIITVVYFQRMYVNLSGTEDWIWFGLFSVLGTVLIFPAILAIAMIFRNFVFYHQNR